MHLPVKATQDQLDVELKDKFDSFHMTVLDSADVSGVD